MPITKKDRAGRLLSSSTSDLTALSKKAGRRASSQDLNLSRNAPLPNKTLNAPWVPPQQHQAPGQLSLPANTPLTVLTAPAEIHRKPVRDLPRDSSSQGSLKPKPASANSSPTSLPTSQPSSPYSPHPLPQSAVDPHHSAILPVPGLKSVSPTAGGKIKRKSWLFGGGKQKTQQQEHKEPLAWIIGHPGELPTYDLGPLIYAKEVPELWNPEGDIIVHLFPRTSGRGPSFRVHSSLYSSSTLLTGMVHGRSHGIPGAGQSTAQLADAQRRHASLERGRRPDSSNGTPPLSCSGGESNSDVSEEYRDLRGRDEGPTHLYLPISLSADGAIPTSQETTPSLSAKDIDTLISARNLFAFLLGQSLVATQRTRSTFTVFKRISDLLTSYGFSNSNGSSFGDVAMISFDKYVEELRLGDVRSSHEKTIESLVLSEKMRSVMLYNEAFVHAAGNYSELQELASPKYEMLLRVTRQRLERASMELDQRIKNVELKLAEFDFPGIFSGIMNSKTADEAKLVRFDSWKNSFLSFRKWFMGFYRHKYGSWPPKASSKKNNLETSGLNRLVLKELYRDLSNLYDLLVNRDMNALTIRTTALVSEEDDNEDSDGPMQRALRHVLGEYDRSTPPVLPPIPFDTPIVPSLTAVGDKKTDAKAKSKKLKKEQLSHVLHESYNKDANISTPFLDAFREYEHRAAEGNTVGHIADLRQGQWIFLYAVLQSLPLLVIDAPAVKWTEGVEYFLCQPPRSGVPWAREDANMSRMWYNVAGGSGIVSLPADSIDNSIEAIYARSHCWQMATKWTAGSTLLSSVVAETLQNPLPAPPLFGSIGMGAPRSRSSSPGSEFGKKRQSILTMGLEPVPSIPLGGSGPNSRQSSPHMRAVSASDPTKTFDAILGLSDANAEAPKKGKKK